MYNIRITLVKKNIAKRYINVERGANRGRAIEGLSPLKCVKDPSRKNIRSQNRQFYFLFVNIT